jgi:hypothetical protein
MRTPSRRIPGIRPNGAARRTVAAILLTVLMAVAACSSAPKVPPEPVSPAPTTSVAPTSTPGSKTATEATGPSALETPTPQPTKPLAFSVSRVLADTGAIEGFGRRVAGSSEEKAAAEYVARRLRSMGYEVTIEKFDTPGGVSRNVTARVRGADSRVLVLGGHLDSKSVTPGANDNALGCAIVLEMARIFSVEKPPVSLEFTLFGAEEYNDDPPRDHHRGSRYHVAHMTKAQLKRTIGMISIDVVGIGGKLYTRTMGIGPMTMSDYLLRLAKKTGVQLAYNKDPGPTGWSDHEAYEKAGIPAVWLERLQDPQYHKAGDTTAHLRSSAVGIAGNLVLDAIRSLDAAAVAGIVAR